MNLDDHAAQLFAENVNMMVPWYLMAAYAYYREDDPILSDHFFDDMAKTMIVVYDDLTHYHKSYISKGDLESGTFLGEYPSIVQGALADARLLLTKTTKRRKKQ
jgi:hypothetical protein